MTSLVCPLVKTKTSSDVVVVVEERKVEKGLRDEATTQSKVTSQ